MTYYLKTGSRFKVSTKAALDLHETLPVGTYTVKFDQMSESFYLEGIEDLEFSGKLYGDTLKTADRILNTFDSRSGSTGVMLSGEKGSGKTLLAKMLSIKAREQGIPTIVINLPWAGEGFDGFMQMIDQPVVVIFDEFEKVYDREDQEKMLTLLDGVYPSKKLFVITCNDKWRVNEHMRNRPGRIFYRIDYTGLTQEFIREYCDDNLDDRSHTESVCRISHAFAQFNFDMLKAMVEEMNRYQESPQEAMQLLNAKPESNESAVYTVKLEVDGAILLADRLEDGAETWHGNPMGQHIVIEYRRGRSDDGPEWTAAAFSMPDLVQVDPTTGALHYTNDKGEKLTLVKVPQKTFNWDAF